MNRKLIQKVNSLLSKEKGTVFKDPGGRINICLIYPNTYYVGMSNLGFQGIYSMLNMRDDVVCERAFLPNDIDEYKRTGTPVFSFESKRPINEFPILAFSISFENDYPNIIKILSLSNIPLQSTHRNEYEPLLIAGGVCAFFNPEPICQIFDVIFVGEGEEFIYEFLDTYKMSSNKYDLKKRSLKIDGIYIPEFYDVTYGLDGRIKERISKEGATEKIKRRYLKDLSASSIKMAITTPETEFSNMYLIEAMRGCPWRCRFCLVGHIYSPVRKKDLDILKEEIEMVKGYRTYEDMTKKTKIGIVGPSLSDIKGIEDVLCIEDVDFSITSLRASKKSFRLIELLKKHKSISIAPEVGTERMRRIINKRITEEDIIGVSELILNSGIENLRLYFIIGLPEEKEDDIHGIVDLVKKIRNVSAKGKITLSISTFVPKPFTPFQWHPMDTLSRLKEKLRFIKKSLKNEKNVFVFHDLPKYAHMQGIFSLGDRRVFFLIREMAFGSNLQKACQNTGIDADFYIFRKKDFDESLPWDFIDIGVKKEDLWKEYQEALKIP
jgi:radical SAM superfamily enzyme YgiQ (UPF0313 family)